MRLETCILFGWVHAFLWGRYINNAVLAVNLPLVCTATKQLVSKWNPYGVPIRSNSRIASQPR